MTNDTAPNKSEATPKPASTPSEGTVKSDAAKPDAAKPEASAPSNYSRGEGQKPVTRAYKENWNAIFGEKAKAPRTRTTKPKAAIAKAKPKGPKTKTAKKTAAKAKKKIRR